MERLPRLTFLFLLTFSFSVMAADFYEQSNLVSDGCIDAKFIDQHLIDPWGISLSITNFAWIANNGTGSATVYDGTGKPQSIAISIPSTIPGKRGRPTGLVSNSTQNWIIEYKGVSAPSSFVFATEDGTILGYESSVNRSHAIIAVSNKAHDHHYTGITSGADGQDAYLYVANFSNNKIEVYNSQFKPVTFAHHFVDPNLPPDYAPFGIQSIRGDIYVTYAKQNSTKTEPVKGQGLGLINVFDANGEFIRRIATHSELNAPWGLALAPSSFGPYSDHLLVGNFGDGKIIAIDLVANKIAGHLTDRNHHPIVINGLRSLSFGNGFFQQPTNKLFFTAGDKNQQHGLYGLLTVKTSNTV